MHLQLLAIPFNMKQNLYVQKTSLTMPLEVPIIPIYNKKAKTLTSTYHTYQRMQN